MIVDTGGNGPLILFDSYPRSKELIFRSGQWERLEAMGRMIYEDEGRLAPAAVNRHFRAATDVYPIEPVPAHDPVRQLEGLLLSAHRSGALRESFFRIGDMTLDDLELILAGLPPIRMQAARPETVARYRSKPGRSYKSGEL